MTMSPDLDLVLPDIKNALPSLAGVYVFGSFATGAARADSDVDLAVLCARPIDPAALLALRQVLAAKLRREVDLIDLGAASTILQMQVMSGGRVLSAPNEKALGMFELRVLRDYHDLKLRRAGYEADIVSRGRVHA